MLRKTGRNGLSSVIYWRFRCRHLTIRIHITGPPNSWLDQLYGSGFQSGSGSHLDNHFMKAGLSPGADVVLRIRPPKVELTPSSAPPVGQDRYWSATTTIDPNPKIQYPHRCEIALAIPDLEAKRQSSTGSAKSGTVLAGSDPVQQIWFCKQIVNIV
jgi:hypothetical protein